MSSAEHLQDVIIDLLQKGYRNCRTAIRLKEERRADERSRIERNTGDDRFILHKLKLVRECRNEL